MKKLMKPIVLGAATAASVVLMGLSAQSASAKVKLVFCNFAPPKHILSSGIIRPWVKDIERATEGRVEVRYIAGCRMAPPPLQLVMTQKGTADGAFVFNAFLRKLVPSTQISIHPQMAETGTGRAVALWRMYQKFFSDKSQYGGVEMVGFFGAPDGYWYSMSDKPILSVAALKPIKMWTLPSVPAQALKMAGANIVPGPAVRVFPIVSKGVVDAFGGLNTSEIAAFKIDKFAKSATRIPGGWFGGTFSTFFNKKKWDTIPARDQAIIRKLGGEALALRSFAWDKFEAQAKVKFLKTRKIHDMPAAELAKLREVWAPLYANWIKSVSAKGVDGKAALDFYRAQAKLVDAETRQALEKK